MKFSRIALVAGAIMALFATSAQAQWSIGAPVREPPPGLQRFAMLVMIDPLPGTEPQFNEFYQNVHMGDLVQLPTWTGAQRFRWMQGVTPRLVTRPYIRGNLIIWDQEARDQASISPAGPVIGGKSRIIDGFDYNAGASVSGTYQVIGPRVKRPDGKTWFMPPVTDFKTPRPNRYLMMDYYDPAPGVSEAAFEAALNQRIREGLAVPGFMGAQLHRRPAAPAPAPPRLQLPRYLIMWEGEAPASIGPVLGSPGAQHLQDAMLAAQKAGQVRPIQELAETRQSTWWAPISPWIDKSDFVR